MEKKTGLKRNTIDKFYTKENIVKICCENIKKYIKIDYNKDIIIEPSAGDGKFINEIKKISKNNLYIDIEPENNKIIKKDFFDLNLDEIKEKYKNIHIIGNPPFGRQSSTAKKFIKKSCEYVKSISFILPKSFKKNSFQNCFDLNFHLIFSMDLPKNSFTYNNEDFDIPCCFQIWIKKNNKRKIEEKLKENNNYKFVKQNENPNISFRRVGINAGFIDKDINKNIQSHYFIKINNFNDNIFNKLKNINFDDVKNNTVGPKSISKQEIIKKYNNILI